MAIVIDNISVSSNPLYEGEKLVFFDLVDKVQDKRYPWREYIPAEEPIDAYLAEHKAEYEERLSEVLAVWALHPGTKEVDDGTGGTTTVAVSINEVVTPAPRQPKTAEEKRAALEASYKKLLEALLGLKIIDQKMYDELIIF